MECGGIYHVGSHGEQFSLVMVRCLGYFCNWLLHFDRVFIVYATVKDDFALPGNHAIRFTYGYARFSSFFLEIKQYLVSLVLMKKTHKNVPT